MRYREPAICLRTTDYSETSQVVHFLTRGVGVVHLLAKGTKRPKSKTGGALDLLSEGDLVFITSGGEAMGTLIEFAESTTHPLLRRNAKRLYTAMFMLELTSNLLAEADPHPDVYDLLHNVLGRLGEPDAPAAAVLAFFQWRLLCHVGLLGDLRTCVQCGHTLGGAGAKRGAHFSSIAGGLLCRDCEGGHEEKFLVDAITLAGLMALQGAPTVRAAGRKASLPDNQADAVNRLLAYHVTYQTAKPLKLARYAIPPEQSR